MSSVKLPTMGRFIHGNSAYPFAKKRFGRGESKFSDPHYQMNPVVPVYNHSSIETGSPIVQNDDVQNESATPNSKSNGSTLSFSSTDSSAMDSGSGLKHRKSRQGGSLYARGGHGMGPVGGPLSGNGCLDNKGAGKKKTGKGYWSNGIWHNTQPVTAPSIQPLDAPQPTFVPGKVWEPPSNKVYQQAEYNEFANQVKNPSSMPYNPNPSSNNPFGSGVKKPKKTRKSKS